MAYGDRITKTVEELKAEERRKELERTWAAFKAGDLEYVPQCSYGKPCVMTQAIQGRMFFHPGTGGLYSVNGYFWDSERNRYMVRYIKLTDLRDGKKTKLTEEDKVVHGHLLEDFLRPGRFLEVSE